MHAKLLCHRYSTKNETGINQFVTSLLHVPGRRTMYFRADQAWKEHLEVASFTIKMDLNNANHLFLVSLCACRHVTFICGRAGVCAIGAVAAKQAGDQALLNQYLTQFKKVPFYLAWLMLALAQDPISFCLVCKDAKHIKCLFYSLWYYSLIYFQ